MGNKRHPDTIYICLNAYKVDIPTFEMLYQKLDPINQGYKRIQTGIRSDMKDIVNTYKHFGFTKSNTTYEFTINPKQLIDTIDSELYKTIPIKEYEDKEGLLNFLIK